MTKRFTVIEISHKFVKVLIGSVYNGQVVAHYVKKTPIHHLLENGVIVDKEALLATIAKINPIHDEQFNIHELINEAILILPPYGLEVYATNQITSVISRERIISQQDIVNLYSIVSNKKLPVDNELIDIIPEIYTIDSGERYAVPPIGKSSRAINAQIKVHTLPRKINNEYSDILRKAGINISHKVVSTFADVEVLSIYKETPKDYFLIDIGGNTTSVSLIGNGQMIASRSNAWGGDNITEKIMQRFNINEKEAEHIKTLYGIDNRKMNFLYPITKSVNGKEHYREELNSIIYEALDTFISSSSIAMEQLKTLYKVDKEIPILVIGGCSKLHGLLGYLKSKFNKESISIVSPKTIGVRDPSMFALLGAVIFHDKHPGVLEDINTSSTPVGRED